MASDSGREANNVYRETDVHGESDTDGDESNLHAPTEHDCGILENEEQEEKLLLEESQNGRPGASIKRGLINTGRRERRRTLRRQQRNRKRKEDGSMDAEGKLMYEMEEGGSKDDANSKSSSSSLDLDRPVQHLSATTKVCHLITDFATPADGRCSASATSSQHQYCNDHNDSVRPACFWVVQKHSQLVSQTSFTQIQ